MSINNLNTYLNVRDAHLRVVSGNVYAQAMNIGGINIETAHGLQSVSDTGNVTSNTLQFSNATTGFITTANAQIGRDLVVTGNATVSTDLTVSANATVTDTLTVSEHLLASKEATVTGNLHVTTIMSDSNVVAEYTGPHDRPLREYPEIAMTTASETSSGYKGYKVSTSSQLSGYEGYKAFDKTGWETPAVENNNAWVSGGSKYVAGTGLPDTGAFTTSYVGGTATGEYIQLQLPRKIKISKYDYTPRTHTGNDEGKGAPKTVKLLGSNDDGSTWTLIKDITHMGNRPEEGEFYTARVDATEYYDYIRFVATSTYSDGTSAMFTDVRLSQIRFYGYEEGSGSLDTTLKSVYNVPATTGTQLEVYYDAKGESTVQSPIPDLSPNTNTGAVSGHSPTLDTTGGIDSFKFNGSSQYVTGAHGLTTGTGPVHTISLWLNATEMTNYTYAVQLGQGGTSHQQSAIMFYENKISHAHWGSGVLSDITIAKNVWYHVVAVFTGGNGSDLSKHKIFINGEDGRVGPFPGSIDGPVVLTGTQLTLGRKENAGGTPGDYFNGSIANFRLYSKALNADQVKELYDYQKDYFLGSKSQVTLYKGHLGVGVTEPSGQLELAGDERIQEYPPRAMTGYETLVEGHGAFCVSASSYYNHINHLPWQAFTPAATSGAADGWNSGNNSTGTNLGYYAETAAGGATSAAALFEGTRGEWVQLKCPYPIIVKKFAITGRSNGVYAGSPEDQPGSGILYGSNDGNNWDILANFSGLTYGGASGGSGATGGTEIVEVNATKEYTYLVLQATSRVTNYGTDDWINIGRLQYFGTPGPTTLDKGSLTLGRSLDVPRVSRYDVDTETPRPEKLILDYDTTVNSSLTDISGNGNHGIFFDDAQYSSADKAFKFDGTDDYTKTDITIAGGNMAWTQSMWFKINAFPASSGTTAVLSFFGNKSSLSGHIMSYKNNEFWQDWYGNGVKANYTLEVGKWYHVVSVYHGNTNTDANVRSSIYINGVKQTLTWYSQTSSQMTLPTSTSYELADYINAYNVRHNGWISNPKLYNVALEPSEVRKLYRLGRTGRSMVISDTAVGIGRAPEAQLDVRGVGKFETIGIGDAIVPGEVDSSISAPLDIIVNSRLHGQANWALNRSIAKFAYSNGTNKYGLSFSVSANNGDGFIQTFNESGGGAQYKLQLQPGGGITQTNGTNVNSDDRVKTDETYIVNATETLMKLKPQTYTRYAAMLDKSHPDLDSWKKYEAGLITQEVYYDAPELRHIVSMSNDADVSGEDIKTSDDPSVDPDYTNWGSDISSLDYTQLIPYLIKSNQELYAEIQTLEHKDHTQELRAENNRLKNKVVILENRQTHFNTLLVDVIGRIEKLERPT